MQFGSRPGKQCQSAVLSKVLSHDIVRLTRNTAAFIENDAVGCYDRLVNNLLLMLLEKLGLPLSVPQCLGSIWDSTIHLIKTIYGTSEITYCSTPDTPLFGPGQGSTCGPLFWLLSYWIIVGSIDPTITAATYVSACTEVVATVLGVSFVDDSSLGVTSVYRYDPTKSVEENRTDEISHTVDKLKELAQHWERLLFTTGRAINMQKATGI